MENFYNEKGCPECGDNGVFCRITGATVTQRIDVISDNDWDIVSENFEVESGLYTYKCASCDFIYASKHMAGVISEMVEKDET